MYICYIYSPDNLNSKKFKRVTQLHFEDCAYISITRHQVRIERETKREKFKVSECVREEKEIQILEFDLQDTFNNFIKLTLVNFKHS